MAKLHLVLETAWCSMCYAGVGVSRQTPGCAVLQQALSRAGPASATTSRCQAARPPPGRGRAQERLPMRQEQQAGSCLTDNTAQIIMQYTVFCCSRASQCHKGLAVFVQVTNRMSLAGRRVRPLQRFSSWQQRRRRQPRPRAPTRRSQSRCAWRCPRSSLGHTCGVCPTVGHTHGSSSRVSFQCSELEALPLLM
jgi:hypothetical protein